MIVESVELKDYRNYDFLDMKFNENVNIIYGDNAQGKTNILESIYMCSTSKSHRGSKDKEIIRFGQDESHIKLNVIKHDMRYRIVSIVIVVLIYRIVNFNDQEESSIRDLQERKKRIQEHYVRSKV